MCSAAEGGQILVAALVRLLAGTRGGLRVRARRGADAEGPPRAGRGVRRALGAGHGGRQHRPAAGRLGVGSSFAFVGRVEPLEQLTAAWKMVDRRRSACAGQCSSPASPASARPVSLRSSLARSITTAQSCCSDAARRSSASPINPSSRRCASRSTTSTRPPSRSLLGRYSRRARAPAARDLVARAGPPAADPLRSRDRALSAVRRGGRVARCDERGAVRCSSSSTTCIGRAGRRCCSCATSSRPCRRCACSSSAPTATPICSGAIRSPTCSLTSVGSSASSASRSTASPPMTSSTSSSGPRARSRDGEDATSLDVVRDETEGNPFFIGEVLRHLAETGVLYEQDGRWATSVPADLDRPARRRARGRRPPARAAEPGRQRRAACRVGHRSGVRSRGARARVGYCTRTTCCIALGSAVQGAPRRRGDDRSVALLARSRAFDAVRRARHEPPRAAPPRSRRDHRGVADPDDVSALARHYGEAAVAGTTRASSALRARRGRPFARPAGERRGRDASTRPRSICSTSDARAAGVGPRSPRRRAASRGRSRLPGDVARQRQQVAHETGDTATEVAAASRPAAASSAWRAFGTRSVWLRSGLHSTRSGRRTASSAPTSSRPSAPSCSSPTRSHRARR